MHQCVTSFILLFEHNRFQDSNPPIMLLSSPQLKTNMPMGIDGHKYICSLQSLGGGCKHDSYIGHKGMILTLHNAPLFARHMIVFPIISDNEKNTQSKKVNTLEKDMKKINLKIYMETQTIMTNNDI